MTIQDYQKQAARTLLGSPGFTLSPDEIMIVWNCMGLVGEAGEFADAVKKGLFHRHGLDRSALIRELGDVLWYVNALSLDLGSSMEAAMEENIVKLQARYPDGFSSEASLNRQENKR